MYIFPLAELAYYAINSFRNISWRKIKLCGKRFIGKNIYYNDICDISKTQNWSMCEKLGEELNLLFWNPLIDNVQESQLTFL